jgi:hypothetical protein
MRKIKIESWKAKDTEGKDIDESLLNVLNVLLMNKKPEELPRGLDNFRLMNRLSKAFDKAEKSKELVLEESDYSFLKGIVEKDVIGVWGANTSICNAIEAFITAKQE